MVKAVQQMNRMILDAESESEEGRIRRCRSWKPFKGENRVWGMIRPLWLPWLV